MNKIFVFDTNTIISAHLLPNSVSRRAYEYALMKGIIVYSTETLLELKTTFLRQKFDKYIDINNRIGAITLFEQIALLYEVTIKVTECRDKKDDKFLELALAANAHCIVSGDKDLLILNPFRHIPILSSGDFLSTF